MKPISFPLNVALTTIITLLYLYILREVMISIHRDTRSTRDFGIPKFSKANTHTHTHTSHTSSFSHLYPQAN